MKKLLFLIIGFCFFVLHSCSIYAMLTQARKVSLKGIKTPSPQVVTQKRTLYTPEKLQGLYTNLPVELKPISPIHGVAKSASGALQKIYAVESEDSATAVRLVQALFYRHGQQFKPTENKSNAAYALNPGVLGLVMGALETDQLQDPQARAYIINEWRAEYKRMTAEKKPFSATKINNLLNIMSDEYEHDKNSARSILLGFFSEKADLTSDHDMIHYLSGINHFFPVFVQQRAVESGVQAQTTPTFFDKLRAFFTQTSYKPQDYIEFSSQLKGMNKDVALDSAMTKNFELAISTILDQRRIVSLYPPQVVRSSYGYQGQEPRSNCVDAAMQDLFNILLYNSQMQSFDLSLLPSNLKVNDAFKRFYEDHGGVSVINTKEVGQAFMNLVSGIPGIIYFSGNYELDAKESNFIPLVNYFLGTNALNLEELGKALSDERRTVTFTLYPADKNDLVKINMAIYDNQTGKELQANLGLKPGHGELQVPDRETGLQVSLLNPDLLAQNYNVSQEAQSLFSIHPFRTGNLSDVNYKVPVSFYYTLSTNGDWDKVQIIKHVLRYNADNKEATDYALTLCKMLEGANEQEILCEIIKSGICRSHDKFKQYIQSKSMISLLKAAWKKDVLDSYFINELYEYILDESSKKTLFADALGIFVEYCEQGFFIYREHLDRVRGKYFIMAKELISQGVDVNVPAQTGMIPLCVAVRIEDPLLVELLLEHGALIDQLETVKKYDDWIEQQTALNIAASVGINKSFLSTLLKHGANPNIYNRFTLGNDNWQELPLGGAIVNGQFNKAELLLQYGANPNMSSRYSVGKHKINTYPLNYVATFGEVDMVPLLIKYGADVNAIDELGKTPLDSAYAEQSFNDVSGIREKIKILKAAGAKTSAEILKKPTLKEKIYEYYKKIFARE